MAVSGLKYSLCALMSTRTTPMSSLGRLLSSFFNSDVKRSAHLNLTYDKSGQVRSLSYDPEPNLDVCTVQATIQLVFGQE